MNARAKNLLYILVFTAIAGVAFYLIYNKISQYSQEQDLQASESSAPTHNQANGLKVYKSEKLGLEFSYPEKLQLKESNGVITLNHQVPFENHGNCDMKGDSKTYPNLSDFNLTIEQVNGNVAQAVKKISPYMPAENFTRDSLKINPGFIDQYKIGQLNGFAIYEGVEGCGHTIYYFPINSGKTLVVTHDMVQLLSGVISSNVKDELLKVPGVINNNESKSIFEGITQSLKFTANSPEDSMCAQVITKAKNSTTGEIKDFPTACLPDGWARVQ